MTKSSLLFCAVAGVILTACTGPAMVSRPVHEDAIVLVSLGSFSGEGETPAPTNDHPAEFTDQDLSVVLRSVMVQKETDFWRYYVLRQDPKPERAFLDEDIASLVPHLKTALAKARPEESTLFVLSRARGEGISEVTSGAVLVRGDRLHMFLANWRTPVTVSRKMERARERPLIPLATLDFAIVPGAYQMALERHDPSFPSWASRTTGVAISPRSALDAPPFSSNLPATETPIGATRLPPSAPAIPSPPPALEMKLRQLKTWRDQDLISEQEYQEQKRKLIESF